MASVTLVNAPGRVIVYNKLDLSVEVGSLNMQDNGNVPPPAFTATATVLPDGRVQVSGTAPAGHVATATLSNGQQIGFGDISDTPLVSGVVVVDLYSTATTPATVVQTITINYISTYVDDSQDVGTFLSVGATDATTNNFLSPAIKGNASNGYWVEFAFNYSSRVFTDANGDELPNHGFFILSKDGAVYEQWQIDLKEQPITQGGEANIEYTGNIIANVSINSTPSSTYFENNAGVASTDTAINSGLDLRPRAVLTGKWRLSYYDEYGALVASVSAVLS